MNKPSRNTLNPAALVRSALTLVGLRGRQSVPQNAAEIIYMWAPTEEQIWRPGMRDAEGKRITAFQHWRKHFAHVPYNRRPTVRQLKTHPDTRRFCDELAVYILRNRARGIVPNQLDQLHPR